MKKVYYPCVIILILGIVITGCSKTKEETNNTRENSTQKSELYNADISVTDIDSTEQIVESENEIMAQIDNSDIPTIDVDSAKQIAKSENETVSQTTDMIIINLQDITSSKLTVRCENIGKERMVLEKIFLMEFIDDGWTEIKRKSNAIYELPSTVIPAEETIQIDFDYESLYGELDKGAYICVIEINGIPYQYEFTID